MAGRSRQAAAKLPSVLSSILQHITGHGVEEVADPYLLRVSRRAWEDLGHKPPPVDVSAAAQRERILKKFFNDYSNAEAVDAGRTIDKVSDPKVFRIKGGDWRAAVRYEPEDGVQWLCRCLALAKFDDEEKAYREFGRLEGAGALLPEAKERKRARGDQFLVSAILALRQARLQAERHEEDWWPAHAQRPGGGEWQVGRAYVEYDEFEDEGKVIRRFILILSTPPTDVALNKDWVELISANVFPAGELPRVTYELPDGTNIQGNERPLIQEELEIWDDEDEGDAEAVYA